MRDDSTLITGLSSAASRRLAESQHKQAEANKSKGAALKPHAQLIMDWIAQEKKDVVNIERLVLDVTDRDNLQAQIIAIGMHLNFLNIVVLRLFKQLYLMETLGLRSLSSNLIKKSTMVQF